MNSWWDTPNDDTGLTPAQYLEQNWSTANDKDLTRNINSIFGTNATIPAVRQYRQSHGWSKPHSGVRFGVSKQPLLTDYETVISDNVLVISDVHADHQDAEWLDRLVGFAIKAELTHCIIAGDLIDFDSLSSFTPAIGTPATDTGVEVDSAKAILSTLGKVFDDVLLLVGNHEVRLARKLGTVSLEMFASMLGASGNVRMSKYHYCVISDSNDESWRITHPRNASTISVKIAGKLADKYRMNTVAAHGHDWGHIVSPSGRYAAACGMVADPLTISYTMVEDNTRPFMSQGAWALVNAQPLLLHPLWSRPEWYVS